MSVYNYTKAANPAQLRSEIEETSIITALDNIKLTGTDSLKITFKATLSAADETTLTTTVTNHVADFTEIDAPVDSDGSPLSRVKVTQTGWQYHMQGIEFTTSTLNSIVNQDEAGDDLGFATIKLYDDQNNEITTQGSADTDCVKTVVDWEPTFDYEIIGGAIKMTQDTTDDIYVYVTAVPDLTPTQGGSKNFVCCVNMKYIKGGDEVKADGRSSKRLNYDATYHTNKMRITMKHDAGIKCDFLIIFETFKA